MSVRADQRRQEATFWLGVLWLAMVAQAVIIATYVEPGHQERGFEFALANALLVVGLVSHAMVSRLRGHLEMAWPGFLFPFAFVLFHFGTFGLDHRWYAPELFHYAWQLSCFCLLAWLSGYDATRGVTRIRQRPRFTVGGKARTPARQRLILFVAKAGLVLGLSLQATLILKYGVVEFFSRVYGKEALTPTADNWLAYLYTLGGVVMMPALVTLCAASVVCTGRLFPGRRWALLVGAYLLTFLLEGDRGGLAMAGLPLVILQHYWVRPITWRQALIIVVAGLTLFGTLKLYRGSKDADDAIRQTFQVATYEMVLHEMGNTLDTVVRSMAIVPRREEYFLGKTYLWAVARALPNVTFQPREWGFVSSKWIVESTAPDIAARFGGFGYSIVAEAYINFAAVGAGIFMLLIGVLAGGVERAVAGSQVEFWSLVLVLLFEIALIAHVRNTAVLFVRGFIWTSAVVLVVRATSVLLERSGALKVFAPRRRWRPQASEGEPGGPQEAAA